MNLVWRAVLPTVTLLVSLVMGPLAGPALADPSPFQPGHVFASVGDGKVQHYDASGSLLDTLDTSVGGFTTGCAFDSGGDLYVTAFSAGTVIRFSGPGVPHQNLGSFGSGYVGSPESIVFDAVGDAYVGSVNGDNDVRKFDSDGTPITSFDVETERRGSDWMDLAQDQRTLFYTSEGSRILRYDTVDRQQLGDFVSNLPGSAAFALRILPDRSVLVADSQSILHLSPSGGVIRTYDVPGEDSWFSLNLDPDRSSFWAGNFGTGVFYRFRIGDDTPLLRVETGSSELFGICVHGEPTAALRRCTIRGTAGNDTLVGTPGDDVICGLRGDDQLFGGGGDDRLVGAAGNDQLFGGAGNDRLVGGAGNDRLFGEDGEDHLSGDRGDDHLSGGAGNDLLHGNSGNDELLGGANDDLLSGGAGNDEFAGGAGKDRLVGGAGNDVQFGNDGDDVLSGGVGDDRLTGGAGEDRLHGNGGNDLLRGGPQDDALIGGQGTDDCDGGAETDTATTCEIETGVP